MPECRMPTHSPYADANAPSQAASGNTVDALYRAALGPVQQPRYLALFERFDQAGRAPVGWNLAASLATLNWMLLHHLWTAALVYVALVEGLALLIFGVGRPLLHWPEQVEWGLFAAFALFAIVLPGLFGDALLYSEIRKRMARALVAAHSIPEACQLLARQASSWRRLIWIAVANGGLFLAIAAAWLWVPEDDWRAGRPSDAQVASGPVQSAGKALPASVPASASTSATASTPTLAAEARTASASAPAVTASGPQTLAASATALGSAAPVHPGAGDGDAEGTRVPDATSPAPAQSEHGAAAALSPSTATAPTHNAAAQAGKASPPPGKRRVPGAASPAASRSLGTPSPPDAPAATPDGAATAPRKAASAPAPASTPTPLGSAPGYYINVGLFAEEANARRAQAKLLNVGLPAFRQTFSTKNGERTRVRVGPFDSEADAQKAATQIRSLQLDALIYRQRG